MTKLLIATNNRGKQKEIRELLKNVKIELVTPEELGLRLEVDEAGDTYDDNATRKALAFAKASGLPAMADDSGLEVDALDGQPGVHSHRFVPGPHATDADRRKHLLEVLQGKPRPWTAHFHCSVAVATPEGEIALAEGECPGEIIPEERGEGGFGYDPVFYLPEHGMTMAELGMALKNTLSHRARAVRAAEPILRALMED